MSTSRKNARRPILTIFIVLVGIGCIGAGSLLLAIAFVPVPDISAFENRQVSQSTKIYDRTGEILLYDYNRDAKRDVIPLDDISQNAINATIAIEDASFYEHGGIRITSFIRAIIVDVLGGSLAQGGSTITQQVVKNTLLTNQKSIIRKINEWALAIKLEQIASKDKIIETYLNTISYGGTLYGIEAASEAFFGKTAQDLDIAEAAYLAAIIQAPSYYAPSGTHRSALDERKDLVLTRMHTLGFISENEYNTAKIEDVSFAPAGRTSIIAPHFVFYILDELKERYGQSALTSGLTVTTTLDADLQAKSEAIIHEYAIQNVEKFNANNAALVATDPQTGQILAMVGSRDFFDTEIDGQYNASLALRQPGSTMKPFVYSLALKRGYTRNTVVFDVPTQFSTACLPSDTSSSSPPCYAPKNFDGIFHGPMTFETALAQSINIPAIKILYLVGVQSAVNLAKAFGLTTLGDANQYGLTVVLGGGEVRLLDLVNAYGAFGNNGIRNTVAGILEVKDTNGSVIASYTPSTTQVLPENIAHDISAMLSDAHARVPEYPLNSPLTIPGYDVAVKTGTTDDTRDAWVVGYSPSIALGVWAGNNDNSPMVKSIAGYIAAPMWHEAMAYAVSKYPKTYFGEPSPIYASVPPMLQGNWRVPDESGTTSPHSLLFWTDKDDPQGPPPTADKRIQDQQFDYWEYAVSAWYAMHPELFQGYSRILVPLTATSTLVTQPEPVDPKLVN